MRILYSVVAALFLIVGAVFFLNWIVERPPVNLDALKLIQAGASQGEVERTLGKPTDRFESNKKWAYSKPLGWSIVYIYFDEQGRFEKYEYDR